MPITVLRIPRIGCQEIDPSVGRIICETAGDILHRTLHIPDPDDKEILVRCGGNKDNTSLEFSFTVGDNEYPGFTPAAFYPKKNQIRVAGHEIRTYVDSLSVVIPRIVINAWKDTTFRLRSTDRDYPSTSPNGLDFIGRNICRPSIRFSISPKIWENTSYGISHEKETSRGVSNVELGQIGFKIAERLCLDDPIPVGVINALTADTDVAVEFDCLAKDGPVPEKDRIAIAETLIDLLSSHSKTREGSASVWVRQGTPESSYF